MPVNYLTFEGYDVVQILFERTGNIIEGMEYHLNPSISYAVNEIEQNRYDGVLSVVINSEKQDVPPISMSVCVVGHFSVMCDAAIRETLLHENAASLLYPYVRAIISTVTSTANIPTLILPVINLAEIFKQQRDQNSDNPTD